MTKKNKTIKTKSAGSAGGAGGAKAVAGATAPVKAAGGSSVAAPMTRGDLPTDGTIYWAVIYETNGVISLRPCGATKEAAIEYLESFFKKAPGLLGACEGATVIKRDMSQITDKWLFGRSKANDVVAKLKEAEAKGK